MAENKLPKPESGDKPKKITTDAPPGGKSTPGAKLRQFGNRAQKFKATLDVLKGTPGANERLTEIRKAQAERQRIRDNQQTESTNGGFT